MKALRIFLLKLVVVSLLIVWVLPWYDLAERFVLVFLTSGTLPNEQAMKPLFYVSAIKLFPFFVLILATPGLGIHRRTAGIAVAIVLYLLMDLCVIRVWQVAPFQKSDPTMAHIIATNVWDMLGKWLLPFLLWFVAAYRMMGRFFPGIAPKEVAEKSEPDMSA